jgi:hypothetical protein
MSQTTHPVVHNLRPGISLHQTDLDRKYRRGLYTYPFHNQIATAVYKKVRLFGGNVIPGATEGHAMDACS